MVSLGKTAPSLRTTVLGPMIYSVRSQLPGRGFGCRSCRTGYHRSPSARIRSREVEGLAVAIAAGVGGVNMVQIVTYLRTERRISPASRQCPTVPNFLPSPGDKSYCSPSAKRPRSCVLLCCADDRPRLSRESDRRSTPGRARESRRLARRAFLRIHLRDIKRLSCSHGPEWRRRNLVRGRAPRLGTEHRHSPPSQQSSMVRRFPPLAGD